MAFTVEQEHSILVAGVLLSDGALCMTWAPHAAIEALIHYVYHARLPVTCIHAPGHVSGSFGRIYADLTGQRVVPRRAERAYQLSQNVYALPSQGHLAAARTEDRMLVREWVEGFIVEAALDMTARTLEGVVDTLLEPRVLYFWKCPNPVAMAAWLAPTSDGASINFVYTPPALRGRGYGKAVSAALGAQMLASGLRHCLILTDPRDRRTNALYQAIGAYALCELMECWIRPGGK